MLYNTGIYTKVIHNNDDKTTSLYKTPWGVIAFVEPTPEDFAWAKTEIAKLEAGI